MVPSSAIRRFGPLVLLALLGATLYAIGAARFFTLEALAQHKAQLQQAVDAHFWPMVIGYVLVFAVVTAAFVPAALVLTLAGGVLFGPWIGGAATVVAATLGALVSCAAVRSAAGPWIARRFERHEGRLKAAIEGVRRHAFLYVLSLRLFPFLPFGAINVAVGLSGAPLAPYVLATFLGGIPTSLIYANLGSSLSNAASAEGSLAASLAQDPRVVVSLAALALLALVPVALRARARARPAAKVEAGLAVRTRSKP